MRYSHSHEHSDIDPVDYAAEDFEISFNDESFFINLTSGRSRRVYVLTPKHAKRLLILLKKDIEKFEKKYGDLKTTVPKKKKTTAHGKRPLGFSF